MDILEGNFEQRMRAAISFAWAIFSKKVGSGIIGINKEASMQLHYAYILNQVMPLVVLEPNEFSHVELETGVKVESKAKEIDLLLVGIKDNVEHKIAVEMKCYRKVAASGKNRGATDIFMKDVYYDLCLLERYCEAGWANKGIALVMNDRNVFVNPKRKNKKCWDYDISQSAIAGPGNLTTQVGSTKTAINIVLKQRYAFNWKRCGDFWFCELEGRDSA
jgi:hypothetical protein